MCSDPLLPQLAAFVADRVEPALRAVPPDRERLLSKLADFVREKTHRDDPANLLYICTHNSRRSHMAQLWSAAAAHHYGLSNVYSFSGGTEVTAFNPRAVDAMRRAGFDIENPGGDNPLCVVRYAATKNALLCHSKLYDDACNPRSGFLAVMTCSAADAACPVVLGAELRIATPYEDPKLSDDTADETAVYDERALQIAVETFWAFEVASRR